MAAAGGAWGAIVKIGIVVDGVSEYASLGAMLPRIAARNGHTFLHVAKADIQPKAPFPVIARACKEAILQLQSRGADLILVVFDREDRLECPGDIAAGVLNALTPWVDCRVSVVVKDTKYENWLIADLDALAAQPVRFKVAKRHRRAIQPNRADAVDAHAQLRSIVQGDYDKVEDSRLIMARAEPVRLGQHSRSFRRFLREAQDPKYRHQSRLP